MSQRRIWSIRRQVLGNIVPVLLGIAVATLCFNFGPMVQAVAGILATWVGIDRFGFFENKKIDHELRVRTGAEGELIGFVYRRPTTIYDAHAEIGLLSITEKKILIVTEDETIEINRAEIVEVSREKKHPLHPPARRMARHKTGKQGSLQTRKPEVQFNDA